MSVAYYVYYRIEPAAAVVARLAVDALFEHVRQVTGIHGVLKRKRGEEHLWMEIYEGVQDTVAFEAALAAAFSESGLEKHLQAGKRHIECFHD
ncbi:MAG: DUF4936 family protein [Burkholderiales bacterium]